MDGSILPLPRLTSNADAVKACGINGLLPAALRRAPSIYSSVSLDCVVLRCPKASKAYFCLFVNPQICLMIRKLDATLERDLLQFRESVAREMLADGYSIDQVARITLLPVGAVQSLSAQAARAAAEGSPLQEQPK